VVNEDQNEKVVRELREEVAVLRSQLAQKSAAETSDDAAEQRRRQLEQELAESQRLIAQYHLRNITIVIRNSGLAEIYLRF
jgi:ElaB/YqjD/DUF883 family membrane-anchored ribosome-binding protein